MRAHEIASLGSGDRRSRQRRRPGVEAIVSLVGAGALALIVTGCDAAASTAADGGLRVDSSVLCTLDVDCDDERFCSGVETCAPDDPAADSRGCVPASPPCAAGQACDEDADRCTTLCAVTEDADGDGARAVECGGDDCDDADPRRYPGNTEVCDLADLDEDCDATTFGERDVDGDGAFDAACCNGETCGTDCDDLRRGTAPTASEVCNGLDDDCDDIADEGVFVMTWPDADFDLHGDREAPAEMRCAGTFGYATVHDDCDDTNPAVHTAQVEICDGRDNDCDDIVDEAPAAVTWYLDADGDGFGSSDPATSRVSCTPLTGYSLRPTDCDDTRAGVSPATPERCDGLDNDCNGRPDFLLGARNTEDDDLDGHADMACPSGDDCDDRDPTSYPGASEICDGRDNDCNGAIDDSTAMGAWWIDRDGDTFGDARGTPVMSCTPVRGHATRALDCDDSSAGRRPGASEVCDGVDDDCDSVIDEGSAREPYYLDADGDGLGAGVPVLACERPIDRVANASDCDDGDRGVGAARLYFVDADGDTWGDPARSELSCGAIGGRVLRGGDCDDGSASTRPMGTEVGGGRDEDCDGAVDEDPAASASCTIAGATAACIAGSCGVAMCAPGLGDCSGGAADGCETSLVNDPANCGMCGRVCAVGERCREDACARVTQIAGGFRHMCALLGTGEVTCWGSNANGELGRGTTSSVERPLAGDAGLVQLYTGAILDGVIAIDSYAGANFTCAVRSSGQVVCWGENDSLQIGADASPLRAPRAVPIPGITTASRVAVGASHACALLTSGAVRCWGSNATGQLASGTVSATPIGTPVVAMEDEGGPRALADVTQISAGNGFTCFLHTGGARVSCAGREGSGAGWRGQLGRGAVATGNYPIADDVLLPMGTMITRLETGGGSYDGPTCAARASGPPLCWGINQYGEIGPGGTTVNTPTPVEPLLFATTYGFAMGYGTLFVSYENASFGPRVAGLGNNVNGQLALGTSGSSSSIPNDARTPTGYLDSLPQQVVGGQLYSCALLASGSVTCWGSPGYDIFGVPSGAARLVVDVSVAVPNVP